MSKEKHDIKLKSLNLNFRKNLRADRGYKSFLTISKDSDRLASLLRNHKTQPIVTHEEIRFRDDMDFLLSYYSIISCSLLAGYISSPLPDKTIMEAKEVLLNPVVKLFYEEYYPLYLPQVLCKYLDAPQQLGIAELVNPSRKNDQIFESLLLLFRSRIEDEDIDGFLFLLDDGGFYDSNLRIPLDLQFVLEIVGSPRLLVEFKVGSQTYPRLDSLVFGFSKFVSYLSGYAALLRRMSNATLFRAAAWQLESYWFIRLHEKPGYQLESCLKNLLSITDYDFFSKNEGELLQEERDKWQEESKKSIQLAMEDITYLKDQELGWPLVNLLSN